MKKFFLITILILFIAAFVYAEEPRFEASLEKNRVSIGNPVYLYLTFYGSKKAERTEIPPHDGLQIKYVGPSTKISVINGEVSESVTHTYLIIPLKKGEFQIGPFSAEYNGNEYEAPPVVLMVKDSVPLRGAAGQTGMPPAEEVREESEPYDRDKIFLTMDIDKRLVYVNEEVPLTIKLYVSGLGLRDIEYPLYSHEGFSAGEFVEPERRREVVNGIRYEVLIFRHNLFGIKEGNYLLGPAKLRCNVLVKKTASRRSSLFGRGLFDDDFFTSAFGYKTYPIEVEADALPVTILPFPKEGRPLNFQGAVGDLKFDAYTSSSKVKVGDPVIVYMTVSGRGNLDTVTAPSIASSEQFKTYEPQVTIKGGKKIYEQVLIPKSENVREIPVVSFSFFNPQLQKYETIQKGPFPLEVTKQPESEEGVKIVSMPLDGKVLYPKEKFGEDIVHIKESIGQLYHKYRLAYCSWLFWLGQFGLTAAFAAFYVTRKRKERILRDKSYARFLRAPKKARKGLFLAKTYLEKKDFPAFYDIIFKVLQEYLAGRFNLPKGNITSQIIEDKFFSAKCDKKTLEMLRDVFLKCEMARYASSVSEGEETEEILNKVKEIIDCMEKIKL